MASNKRDATAAERADLEAVLDRRLTGEEFQRRHGCGRSRLSRLLREARAARAGAAPPPPPPAPPPDVSSTPDTPEGTSDAPYRPTEADVEAYVMSLVDTTERKALLSTEEAHVRRTFPHAPVGFVFTGDWHWGAASCAGRQLIDDMRAIGEFQRAHPGALYAVHTGDANDNYLPHLGKAARGLTEASEPSPVLQEEGVRWILRHVEWLALTRGCHEAWGLPAVDLVRERAAALGAINGGWGFVLDARVGAVDYRLEARHRWRRESSLNTTNAHRAMDDDFPLPDGVRADVWVLGHLHNADLQDRSKGGRRVVFLRVGGYKGADDHALQGGWALHRGRPDVGNPVVILDPDRHDVIAYPGRHWRRALADLARMRAAYTPPRFARTRALEPLEPAG